MKKVLLIASFIGIFMAASMDLQARDNRNTLPQQGRSGISFGLSRHAPRFIATTVMANTPGMSQRDFLRSIHSFPLA